MTPASGQISMSNLRAEVNTSTTAQVDIKDYDVRRCIGQENIIYNDLQVALGDHYDSTSPLIIAQTGDTLSAVGTAWNPGTADYTQCVVEINAGYFTSIERFNGGEVSNSEDWSPIGSSETASDYEVKYDFNSGGANFSMGPGWAAEGVWTTLGTTGFYFSMTDTTQDAGTLTGNITVSFRPSGTATWSATTDPLTFDLTCNYTS